MSKICDICGKSRQTGNNVSHSKRHTPHTWQPNLAKLSITKNGVTKSVMACGRCRKTVTKPKVVRKRATA